MNSRERIRLALSHKEADRVPIDFGGTCVTTISTQGYNKLRNRVWNKKGAFKNV